MVEAVWRFYFDASRALVPVLTVYILSVAASRKLLTSSESPLNEPVERAIHPSTN
jgi:hypothetical protein